MQFVPFDEARTERIHAYARRLLRETPPPADEAARALRDEIVNGPHRPAQLLSTGEYDRIADAGLQRLGSWWRSLSAAERTATMANADAEMDRVLGDEGDARSGGR